MEENISSAKSRIGDADFAVEMSRLVRAEIMVNTATATMALAGERHRLIGGLLG